MDELKLKTLGSTVLSATVRLSKASPLGHALRADIARAVDLDFYDTLQVLCYLSDRGDIVLGQTINDYWARPANGERL